MLYAGGVANMPTMCWCLVSKWCFSLHGSILPNWVHTTLYLHQTHILIQNLINAHIITVSASWYSVSDCKYVSLFLPLKCLLTFKQCLSMTRLVSLKTESLYLYIHSNMRWLELKNRRNERMPKIQASLTTQMKGYGKIKPKMKTIQRRISSDAFKI